MPRYVEKAKKVPTPTFPTPMIRMPMKYSRNPPIPPGHIYERAKSIGPANGSFV